MAWGYASGYGRPPAPRRLTLEELLGEDFSPSPRPSPLSRLRELADEDRSEVRRDSTIAGIGALGALVSGDQRRAAAGVGDIQDIQARALAAANARQDEAWQAENAQRAHQLDRQKREQSAKALLGMYDEVTEGESGDFAAKAERAARSGSMSELEGLREQKPRRAAARAKGYDPDAWDTTSRLQEELAAELEAAKQRSLIPVKAEESTAVGKAKTAQELAEEEEKKRRKLGGYYQAPPQYEPLSRVAAREELVQGIRDKHEAARAGGGGMKGRLGQAPNGAWGWISPPDATNPHGKFTPIDGQPVAKGNFHFFSVDGRPYAINQEHPEMGARELPVAEEGDEKAGSLKDFFNKPAAAAPAIPGDPHPERPLAQRVADVEAAVGRLTPEEKAHAQALLGSMLPRDVVAGIRRARAGH